MCLPTYMYRSVFLVSLFAVPFKVAQSQTITDAEQEFRAGRKLHARSLAESLLSTEEAQPARLLIAKTYLEEPDCSPALPFLQSYLRAAPASAAGLGLLGACLSNLDRNREAEAALQQSLQLRRQPSVIKQLAALYLKTDRMEAAKDLISEIIDVDDPEIPYLRALISYGFHDYADTVQLTEKALSLRPNYKDAEMLCAQALTDLLRYDDAEWAYRAAIRMNERDPTPSAVPYYRYAQLLMVNGRSSEAILQFDKALTLKPQCVPALLGKAQILFASRKMMQAKATGEAALAADPNNDAIRLLLLKIYVSLHLDSAAAAQREWLHRRNQEHINGRQ